MRSSSWLLPLSGLLVDVDAGAPARADAGSAPILSPDVPTGDDRGSRIAAVARAEPTNPRPWLELDRQQLETVDVSAQRAQGLSSDARGLRPLRIQAPSPAGVRLVGVFVAGVAAVAAFGDDGEGAATGIVQVDELETHGRSSQPCAAP